MLTPPAERSAGNWICGPFDQTIVPNSSPTPAVTVIARDVIRPCEPHHLLHHLVHEELSREEGQRAPEEPAYYEKIADAVALGGKIVVVGHGAGKSNAAHHLTEYLRSHHSETYQRIVREIVADLSSITTPQLLDLARQALRS